TPERLIPSPDPADSERVVLNLETAQALEMNGDLQEALRWLRRAAYAAEQDGNDRRAVALARAAADMTAHVGASGSNGEATVENKQESGLLPVMTPGLGEPRQ